jgi:cysteine synthase
MAELRPAPGVLDAIGNTPVVRLARVVPASSAEVVVKLEYFNPTGSYKDRMALAMIEEAEARDDLKPGMTVVEYTGGSTGSSLAFVCAVKGYRFKVVSSDAFAEEKLRTMEAFGAELTMVPSREGRITPDLLPRMIAKAREIAASEPSYWTNQLYNRDSIKGYERIGQELVRQLDRIDVFCGAVGTAGMTMGVARALRAAGSKARVVVLEPAAAALITGGPVGAHRVEGIGIGMLPPLLDRELYDEARAIDEEEAREMARRLASEEGVFGGVSSGLNVAGAIQLAGELGPGYTVATVCVDTGLKYLAGDLFHG